MGMIASAPGKVILFGEHAVVYGRAAVVGAIGLRCYVEVRRSDEVRIESPLGVTGLDFSVHPYVSYAIKRFSELVDFKGVNVRIRSEVPIASGLGSSAAVTVATIKALDEEFGAGMSMNDVFEMARLVELDVQGKGSGIDPFISTFGGVWVFPERRRVKCGDLEVAVLMTGKRSLTAEMVKAVAELRESYPEVVERIFDAINSISVRGAKAVEEGDLKALKDLFRMNHCMLRALGVSCREVEEAVSKLESLGMAAKVTGAGGGGCVIGIGEEVDRVREVGGFKVRLGEEGVRVEEKEHF